MVFYFLHLMVIAVMHQLPTWWLVMWSLGGVQLTHVLGRLYLWEMRLHIFGSRLLGVAISVVTHIHRDAHTHTNTQTCIYSNQAQGFQMTELWRLFGSIDIKPLASCLQGGHFCHRLSLSHLTFFPLISSLLLWCLRTMQLFVFLTYMIRYYRSKPVVASGISMT